LLNWRADLDAQTLKLIDTTIVFLQYMTSVLLIILTASGALFYYYWTTKLERIGVKGLWPFALPAGIILTALVFIGFTYRGLVVGLSSGILAKYIDFWFKYVGVVLWPALFLSIVGLFFALIMVHRS
jgi:hypothetical protein